MKYRLTRIINIKFYFVLYFYLTTPTIMYDIFAINFNVNVYFFPAVCDIVSDNRNDLIYELAITLINCIAHVVYTR